MALAKVESSWHPWCVTIAGRGYYPKSRAEAARLADAALAQGKSVDVGLMQINSYWLRKWKLSAALALDPDINVTLGLYILAREKRRHGSLWKAVGAYHSPTPVRQKRYARKVARALAGIERRFAARSATSDTGTLKKKAADATRTKHLSETGMLPALPGPVRDKARQTAD